MYNYMFLLLIIIIFRLYMDPYKVVTQDIIWAVYSGDVGDEVGTRSRTCHEGWGVGTWGNCCYVYLS